MDNKTTSLMALMGIAILSSGLTYAMTQPTESPNPMDSEGVIYGHLTATLRDGDGNIQAYRQTDNLIVDSGFNIMAIQVFGNSSTLSALPSNIAFNNAGTAARGSRVPRLKTKIRSNTSLWRARMLTCCSSPIAAKFTGKRSTAFRKWAAIDAAAR